LNFFVDSFCIFLYNVKRLAGRKPPERNTPRNAQNEKARFHPKQALFLVFLHTRHHRSLLFILAAHHRTPPRVHRPKGPDASAAGESIVMRQNDG